MHIYLVYLIYIYIKTSEEEKIEVFETDAKIKKRK